VKKGLEPKSLREALDYNPETGVFTWAQCKGPRAKPGTAAGYVNSEGYVQIQIDGQAYSAHRLAWLYTYGVWPTQEIDHMDGVRSNNQILNLREATRAENGRNQKRSTSNTSGFKGVCWDKCKRRWLARIRLGGKLQYVGLFKTAGAASDAYQAKAFELFGAFKRKET